MSDTLDTRACRAKQVAAESSPASQESMWEAMTIWFVGDFDGLPVYLDVRHDGHGLWANIERKHVCTGSFQALCQKLHESAL